MQYARLEDLPKFKTPEEEVDFLRKMVIEKEREVREHVGPSKSKEHATQEVLKQYKSAPVEEVIHPEHQVSEKQAEKIVLKLKPETHDGVIEELFGLLVTKGLKNTLSIVEKMDNPHVDDDFHRFLIQYLKTTEATTIKERLSKPFNMALFSISLPPAESEEDQQKGFKDFIGAMEQFYAGMQSISEGVNNAENNYFTLEIALDNDKEEVVIYSAVPNRFVELFEKQVLAFYQNSKIISDPDDYNIFKEHGAHAGSYASLSESPVMPIQTYEDMDHDPMNTTLNAFSKLKTQGEGAAIQIVVAPAGDKFIKQFHQILDEVEKGSSVKFASDSALKWGSALKKVSKEVIFGVQKKEESKEEESKEGKGAIDNSSVEKINKKLKSSIVRTNIRILASADTPERAGAIVKELESAFNQFSMPASNSFKFTPLLGAGLKRFLHNFSYREFDSQRISPLNFKELASVFHFPVGVTSQPNLKEARAGIAPAPMELSGEGALLGINDYRGKETEVRLSSEDRMRHFYVIGQTGTGKTNILLNMITQDIREGKGVCYIDPHGTDIQTILSRIPKERLDDVVYFDPAYTARPMGLNMLEYDPRYPEQKTFVVNELMSIFNKLFDMKVGGGAMFEQYFRNSAFLVMEDPESGSTLLEITRVLGDKKFRDYKLSRCKNPIIKQFWINAEETTGEQSLANFVPYISSKFDNFISNDIMRPVVLQQESAFNFRKIMDEGKILLVNLSKGRLGDINANLIGLVLVGKIQMAALSRVDMYGQDMKDFYLYIDEFQNVTTDSISSILSEARKYRLSLNVAHQYINQLEDGIKNAIFGNVGSMAVFRVGNEDAKFLEDKFKPTFSAGDITRLENYNAYVSMLSGGQPVKPFNIRTLAPEAGNPNIVESIKELSYMKYGRDREEIESEIMSRYEGSK